VIHVGASVLWYTSRTGTMKVMTAAKRNFYIEQGATFTLPFIWYEGTADAPGNPVDLTGCTARMQFRKSQKSPLILDASSENTPPQIEVGDTDGKITILLSDDDTDMLSTKSCVYDLEVEFPDGRVVRLLEGSVTVSPNITQEIDDPVLVP
jgi:hypothetical protein